MQHIIIGAGPAGITACETIRKLDKDAEITLITGQNEAPYSRMAIPYLLEEKIPESGTYLRQDKHHFIDLRIKILYDKVQYLDSQKQQLSLVSGNQLSYDKLLVASGASPITPPIPGIEHPLVQNCWSLDDARKITQKAIPGASVVLMGAGFIGCIILESLVKRGVQLTIVEMGERMVPRMMDDAAANMLKNWCESKGVKILTQHQVTAIEATSHDTQKDTQTTTEKNNQHQRVWVKLKEHETLVADLVICATGVKSNMEFLTDSGIELDQGIRVNEYLQTSHENVYAAGDVAQGFDFSDNSWHVQAIQPTAVEHGRIAASNMVKPQSCRHHGSINMNILDTLGLISTSFGLWMGVPGGEQSVLIDETGFRYLNLQFDGEYLIGVSSLGHTENIGVVRGLIRTRVKLGAWKERLMKNPNRLMEAYLANAMGMV